MTGSFGDMIHDLFLEPTDLSPTSIVRQAPSRATGKTTYIEIIRNPSEKIDFLKQLEPHFYPFVFCNNLARSAHSFAPPDSIASKTGGIILNTIKFTCVFIYTPCVNLRRTSFVVPRVNTLVTFSLRRRAHSFACENRKSKLAVCERDGRTRAAGVREGRRADVARAPLPLARFRIPAFMDGTVERESPVRVKVLPKKKKLQATPKTSRCDVHRRVFELLEFKTIVFSNTKDLSLSFLSSKIRQNC
ncbi:hypothetical protein EVAR_35573_1 [Eumeta japonica]|uniref:Uncharacterized protein n=1 Tax=Eumeta variegata TaxID=151549 RepID=A0A4C1XNN5_EUMVA|nr:hypothetical protein EVAR_35573_1 [Eumeta japonica]